MQLKFSKMEGVFLDFDIKKCDCRFFGFCKTSVPDKRIFIEERLLRNRDFSNEIKGHNLSFIFVDKIKINQTIVENNAKFKKFNFFCAFII